MIVLVCGQTLAQAQYYDSTQISNINIARTAAEGDMYLDTINDQYYIGITTGELAELGSSSSWLRLGNDSATNGQFLGTIKDAKLSLRSFNTPVFEIGERETLGLYDPSTTGIFPYNESAAFVSYVRGTNGVSALEFEAGGASFYKPIFFTDTDGNFKMRGSSANTDFFEIGSSGTANNGQLDFVIGDDGNEPMTFRKYNYSPVSYVEMMRLQGVGLNSTVRASIATNGVIGNSTLQVGGSFATNIRQVASADNLDETDYTVILTNNSALKLPDADTCEGRIYYIKKTSAGMSSISAFLNDVNASTTTLSQGTYQLQSDGINWHQVNSGTAANSSVYGSNFNLFQSAAQTSTTSTTLQTKINQTTTSLPVGKYELTVSYLWNFASTGRDFISDFTFGGSSVTSTAGNTIHRQEPKDAGADQSFSFSKKFYVDVITAGAKNVLLSYRSSNGSTARIWNATVKVIRVQ